MCAVPNDAGEVFTQIVVRSTENQIVTSTKLFISHAASDQSLVNIFADLVESGIGVSPFDIFCSSRKGQGVPPGDGFMPSIGAHLDEATCVIALITPNFYGSGFCMCELGVVWIQAKSFIPILVPPLEVGDLKAVLAGLQVLKIGDKADLDELRDEIVKRISIPMLPTPRWNERRDAFLKSLPNVLKQLPAETPVDRETHKKTLKELEHCKSEYKKSQAEVQRLQAVNAGLSKLKDVTKAAAVVRRHSSSAEAFESLVRAANDSLRPLPSGVREALYYRARDEDYYPNGQEQWDDVRRPIENGQLTVNDEENGVCPCDSDSKVRKAIAELDELKNWLDEPSSDFCDWYGLAFGDAIPNMRLRPFWEKHLLQTGTGQFPKRSKRG